MKKYMFKTQDKEWVDLSHARRITFRVAPDNIPDSERYRVVAIFPEDYTEWVLMAFNSFSEAELWARNICIRLDQL